MTMLVLYSLLLIALAYVIGCILGCLARRFFSAKEEPRYVARAEDNRYGRPAAVAVAQLRLPLQRLLQNQNRHLLLKQHLHQK